MGRHLNLDRDKVDQCYETAGLIISHTFKFIDRHSSTSIEKATLMLLGLGGYYRGKSWASWLVDSLTKDQLRLGVAHWWGRVLVAGKEEPLKLAEKLARGKMKWEEVGEAPFAEIKRRTLQAAKENLQKISVSPFSLRRGEVSVALRFADSKAKRLKNDVSGWQQNENVLALAELHSDPEEFESAFEKLERSRTLPVLEGLAIPEQAVILLARGFSALEVDGFSSLSEGKIDEKRSLIDHAFVLGLCAQWGVKILSHPSVSLAHLLLYEQMARKKGVSFENVMLSALTGSIAAIQLLRELFSQSAIWLKLEDEKNPFSLFAARFAEVGVLEISGPDFLEEASRQLEAVRDVDQEFSLNTYGRVAREAHALLDQAWKLLKKIDHLTLWKYFEKSEGEGKEGVFQKSYHYWNPVTEVLKSVSA